MKNKALLLLCVAAVSFAISTSLFWHFEHTANSGLVTFLDVVYWWTVTSATVGYGDIVPHTWQGKVVVMFTIVTGFFIFANLVAIIAESVHGYLDRKKTGKAQVKARNHIVICEYTAIADELVQSLPSCPDFAGLEVAIVSDLVQQNPYPQHHFVNGVPINPAALKQANIEYAAYVFIFANLRFADPDVKTMHIALRVRNLNKKAVVFVEMVDPSHKLLEHTAMDLIPMDSHELMENVLQQKRIDPSRWMRKGTKTS
jgi:voltage-gated potassium channel